MTRLSLHPGDENPSLSIHLREGQYCTVGASAAADYSFPSAGVEPIHCRIGCQSSGGYVECFDALASVFVNDDPKNRSRLSNGDKLRIGSVELRVELPEAEKPLANFSVEFDADDSPTTEVAQAHSFEPKSSSHAQKSFMDDFDEEESIPDSSQRSEDTKPVEAPSAEAKPAEAKPAEAKPAEAKPAEATSAEPATKPESDLDQTEQKTPTKKNDDHSKPQFEFDSTEPSDVSLSKTEFDQLVETSTEQVLMGAVDLEGALKPGPIKVELDETESNETESNETESNETGVAMSGASFQGKYYRWSGRQAIKAIETVIESNPDLKFYRSELNRLSSETPDEFSLDHLVALQPAVFFLSSSGLTDLQFLVREKRWEDRIGHPQAVTMFLTFLPKKMFNDFFETFDACILIHENDVELLRAQRTV